jgi:cobalt/nickel transport system permease protein
MKKLGRAADGIAALEEYTLKDSALKRIHPGAKIISAAVYIVCAASFPASGLSGAVPYVLYPVALLPMSHVPFTALVKYLVPVLPFALAGGIANLVFMKEPAFVLGNLAVSEGAVSCALIMLKAVLCASAAMFLAASTPFHVICAELARLRVPALFCIQLAMMYRYIAVLLEEASAMYRAYMLRSAEKAIRMKDAGPFLGHLALRSMNRAASVYNAMKCRGWTGNFHAPKRRFRAADWVYCLSVCLFSIVFRCFNAPRFVGNLVLDVFA